MAFHSLYNSIKYDPAFINRAAGSTFQYSQVFDMNGFEGIGCLLKIGTITTAAVCPLYAEGSTATAGTYVSYYGSTATLTDLGASGDVWLFSEVYRPKKRYVRFVAGRATANTVIDGGIVMRYRASSLPVGESTMTTAGGTNIGGWMQDYGICTVGTSS